MHGSQCLALVDVGQWHAIWQHLGLDTWLSFVALQLSLVVDEVGQLGEQLYNTT